MRAPGQSPPAPVDLSRRTGEGPLWGLASEDLNATLLSWGPGAGVVEHVNDERDVLLIVIDGSGVATIDGQAHPLGPHHALLIEKGTRRQIQAASHGLQYVSIHLRRGALQIEPRRSAVSASQAADRDNTARTDAAPDTPDPFGLAHAPADLDARGRI